MLPETRSENRCSFENCNHQTVIGQLSKQNQFVQPSSYSFIREAKRQGFGWKCTTQFVKQTLLFNFTSNSNLIVGKNQSLKEAPWLGYW